MTRRQEILGQNLKRARLSVKLTQEQVARAVGMPRTAVVKAEQGARAVSSMELMDFADLYRTNVTALLGLGDDGTREHSERALEKHFGVRLRAVRRRLGWERGLPEDLQDYTTIKLLSMVLRAVREEQGQ